MDAVMITSIVRHALTFIGGAAVAKGLLDSSTADQAIGALTTLVGIVWSLWIKRKPAA